MTELQDPIPRSPREAFEYEQKTIELLMKAGLYKKPEIGFDLKLPPVREDAQMLFLNQFKHDLRSVAHIYESSGRMLLLSYGCDPVHGFGELCLNVTQTDSTTGTVQSASVGWDEFHERLWFYAKPYNKDHLCWEVVLPKPDQDHKRLREVAYWFAQATGRFLMMDDYPVPHKLCGYDVTHTGPTALRWVPDSDDKAPQWVQNYILRLEN